MYRVSVVFLTLILLAACGGGGGSRSSTPPPGGGGGGGGGSAANPPVTVNVSSGLTAAGVDINVPSPVSSPAPNISMLGVSSGNSFSVTNTGAVVHPGDDIFVAVTGTGLSTSMTVQISGPGDITLVGANRALQSGDGLAFEIKVSSSAALGARTVLLKNAQDDITTFTGGLEVIP